MRRARTCETCARAISADREQAICAACEADLLWPPRSVRLLAAIGVITLLLAVVLIWSGALAAVPTYGSDPG